MLISLKLILKADGGEDYSFFTGVYTHAMVLDSIRKIDAALAEELHEKDGLKLFTVSALFSAGGRYVIKVLQGKRYEVHLSFMDDRIFKAFYEFITKQEPNVRIGQTSFLVENLDITRISEVNDLEEKRINERFSLEFYTPTSFRSEGRNYIFPDSSKVLRSIADKWNNMMEQNQIPMAEIEELAGVFYAVRHEIKSAIVKTKNYYVNGFIGKCEYEIAKEATSEARKKINQLMEFGIYSGVGYKTTMGMGRYRKK